MTGTSRSAYSGTMSAAVDTKTSRDDDVVGVPGRSPRRLGRCLVNDGLSGSALDTGDSGPPSWCKPRGDMSEGLGVRAGVRGGERAGDSDVHESAAAAGAACGIADSDCETDMTKLANKLEARRPVDDAASPVCANPLNLRDAEGERGGDGGATSDMSRLACRSSSMAAPSRSPVWRCPRGSLQKSIFCVFRARRLRCEGFLASSCRERSVTRQCVGLLWNLTVNGYGTT